MFLSVLKKIEKIGLRNHDLYLLYRYTPFSALSDTVKGTPNFCKTSLFGVQMTTKLNSTGRLLVSVRGNKRVLQDRLFLVVRNLKYFTENSD